MKHKILSSVQAQRESKTSFRSKQDYEKQLRELQISMLDLQQLVRREKLKVILIFEGRDAAGKGGVIKRLTESLDPRGFRVHAIGAPDALEQRQNYWQRFFSRLPKAGTIAIFDRSWYGRVLVERVDDLIPKKDWARAYDEINMIEKMLRAEGALILKYCLDVSSHEQKARFKARAADPLTKWKLTEDDWKNRARWEAYHKAFKDMLKHTSTDRVPWRVVPADSKWSARVSILRDVTKRARHAFK